VNNSSNSDDQRSQARPNKGRRNVIPIPPVFSSPAQIALNTSPPVCLAWVSRLITFDQCELSRRRPKTF
jgi:hypothetical protein